MLPQVPLRGTQRLSEVRPLRGLLHKFLIHRLPAGVSVYIQMPTTITANTINTNTPAFIYYFFKRLLPIQANPVAIMPPVTSIITNIPVILSL